MDNLAIIKTIVDAVKTRYKNKNLTIFNDNDWIRISKYSNILYINFNKNTHESLWSNHGLGKNQYHYGSAYDYGSFYFNLNDPDIFKLLNETIEHVFQK